MKNCINISEQIELLETCSSNIFDMAVFCYELLAERVENQTMFISQYMDVCEAGTEFQNPNLQQMNRFKSDWKTCVDQNEQEMFFGEVRRFTAQQMNRFQLIPFEDEKLNQLTPFMALLQAIDLYLIDAMKEKRIFKQHGPMNNCAAANYGVYLKYSSVLLDDIAERNFYRYCMSSSNIADSLKNVVAHSR